ncbi:MAG: TetR/AcrR family transcriptional regulator [Pseudomonadota bacterium]
MPNQATLQRRRAPELKRSALIAAATELFMEQGFSETTTQEIAKHAGVSEGILFHHFGSKRGLFDAIAQDFLHEGAMKIMPATPKQMSEENVVRAAFDFMDQHPALHRLLIQVGKELGESQNTTLNHLMIDVIEMQLQSAMTDVQFSGKIRQGNPRIMAQLQFAVVDAAYKAWQASGTNTLREDYIAEAVNCMTAMLRPEPQPS